MGLSITQKQHNPSDLKWLATILVVTSLFLDLQHYQIASIFWGAFARKWELKKLQPDLELVVPQWRNHVPDPREESVFVITGFEFTGNPSGRLSQEKTKRNENEGHNANFPPGSS